MSAWTCSGSERHPVDDRVELAVPERRAHGGGVADVAPCSTGALGRAGGRALRPRLSTVTLDPRSTASREQAELMTPLPPMNRTLGALMQVTVSRVRGRAAQAAPGVGAA